MHRWCWQCGPSASMSIGCSIHTTSPERNKFPACHVAIGCRACIRRYHACLVLLCTCTPVASQQPVAGWLAISCRNGVMGRAPHRRSLIRPVRGCNRGTIYHPGAAHLCAPCRVAKVLLARCRPSTRLEPGVEKPALPVHVRRNQTATTKCLPYGGIV